MTPTSRVIALLRNPVDQMHSQHSEMLFQGDEDIASFAEAIDAEEDRRRGERVPPGCQKVFGLLYRDIARYGDQVERYLSRVRARPGVRRALRRPRRRRRRRPIAGSSSSSTSILGTDPSSKW